LNYGTDSRKVLSGRKVMFLTGNLKRKFCNFRP